jgi:2-amino-4-hydroxy-6-hydroxymethyldihydropteridine diphosphokinase
VWLVSGFRLEPNNRNPKSRTQNPKPKMATVYLGIGSNIGDREANLKEAVHRLEMTENAKVAACSSFYLTKPAGGPPQEDYLNGVLKVETGLPPGELLDTLKNIEKEMGREDPAGKNYPRIIDIDILLYDGLVMETDKLFIPHPRMHEREFVLEPFAEIAPEAVHPALERTVRELYEGLTCGRRS